MASKQATEDHAFDNFCALNFPAASSRDRQTYRRIWNSALEYADPKRARKRASQVEGVQKAQADAQAVVDAGRGRTAATAKAPRHDGANAPPPLKKMFSAEEMEAMGKTELVAHSQAIDPEVPAYKSWKHDEIVEHILGTYEELGWA